jgi:hypothetical protein
LIDNNEQAMQVMARRFSDEASVEWIGFDPNELQKNDYTEGSFPSG